MIGFRGAPVRASLPLILPGAGRSRGASSPASRSWSSNGRQVLIPAPPARVTAPPSICNVAGETPSRGRRRIVKGARFLMVRRGACQESRAMIRTRGRAARSAVPAGSSEGSLGEAAATWNRHRPSSPPASRLTRVKAPAGVCSPLPRTWRLPDSGGQPVRLPVRPAASRVTPWKDAWPLGRSG